MNINDLIGPVAFLNGTEGLDSIELKFYNSLKKAGIELMLLDNLFEQPGRLDQVVAYDNLVLFTTNLRAEKTAPLIERWQQLKFVPKNVIFLSEETALTFAYLARELKKYGTKFYFVDFIDQKTLFSVKWI